MMTGCATTTSGTAARHEPARAVAPPLDIRQVAVEPKTVGVSHGERTSIRYQLTRPAMVVIDLVDENGCVVRQLNEGPQAAGSQAASWDGRMTDGRSAAAGVYRYMIHAQDDHGGQAVLYDPSTEAGGEELEPRDFTYDRQTGLLAWVMPKAGFARLRIGVEGFPHLLTVLDWTPLEGGRHELTWNGQDGSGLINLKEHPNLSMKLVAFAMPPNTIIVRGDPSSSASAAQQAPRYSPIIARETVSFHAKHLRSRCHEVSLQIDFPSVTRKDADGRPILSGIVPVRVTVDPRDATWMINERFEIAFFEDLTIIFETEDGSTPMTAHWDTTHLSPGPHLLTVNLLSYEDHDGVATRPVVIERAP